ncbi:hypothetical protein SAY87_025306 [Trapa incisa]|uniref:CAAX prenyl protease 2/Lysostaphin resistance protein A-like domain-containing protein n=1 Tax=Trapa incisa TaxID=236973 RepID=A0AAN7GDF6_9MYRT|nr:hypothetical protein SAY87_025306 [Trapa incisa]
MILAHRVSLPCLTPTSKTSTTPFLYRKSLVCSSIFRCDYGSRACVKCSCTENGDTQQSYFQGFSVLGPEPDVPFDSKTMWSTLSFYLFSVHIPLSFGGLSIVAHVLHQSVLDPQTEALSLLAIQLIELVAAVCLLQTTMKPQFKLMGIFKVDKLPTDRSLWLGSAAGFSSLVLLVFLSSFLTDSFIGPKSINNSVLKEILTSTNLARAACTLAYCLIIPTLEELMYRGFLLRSISSTMKWQQSIFLSSVIFSAIHFSGENFLQLFMIGCVLGCSYCWTGDLRSSILIHSLYNAMILAITYVS